METDTKAPVDSFKAKGAPPRDGKGWYIISKDTSEKFHLWTGTTEREDIIGRSFRNLSRIYDKYYVIVMHGTVLALSSLHKT